MPHSLTRRVARCAAALLFLGAPIAATGREAVQEVLDANRLPRSQDPKRVANGLAQTPPMGWNRWNKFGCRIDEKAVRRVADAMVASGMRDAGYDYVHAR